PPSSLTKQLLSLEQKKKRRRRAFEPPPAGPISASLSFFFLSLSFSKKKNEGKRDSWVSVRWWRRLRERRRPHQRFPLPRDQVAGDKRHNMQPKRTSAAGRRRGTDGERTDGGSSERKNGDRSVTAKRPPARPRRRRPRWLRGERSYLLRRVKIGKEIRRNGEGWIRRKEEESRRGEEERRAGVFLIFGF
ncbi:hypothetical protein LINPERPRIM_LOCUS35399, partial [Linum perenne]